MNIRFLMLLLLSSTAAHAGGMSVGGVIHQVLPDPNVLNQLRASSEDQWDRERGFMSCTLTTHSADGSRVSSGGVFGIPSIPLSAYFPGEPGRVAYIEWGGFMIGDATTEIEVEVRGSPRSATLTVSYTEERQIPASGFRARRRGLTEPVSRSEQGVLRSIDTTQGIAIEIPVHLPSAPRSSAPMIETLRITCLTRTLE